MKEDKLKWSHEKFLYPVVRVFAEKAGGSGTIVYSEQDPENKEENITLVLTNHHVIDDLISHKEEWDSLLKRKKEKEFKKKAKVERFEYVRMSTVDSSNRYDADILAYDKNEDLAILRINSPRKFEYVANLIPKKEIKNLRLFQDVVVGGCSLLHEPFCNFGQITFLTEEIDQKQYLMTNSNSVFGNSGGALFLKETGQMIGVPSRITGIQLGFGVDIMTWMGFAAHPKRIYGFLEEQELKFIWDKKDTYAKAMKRRDTKEKTALLELKAQLVGSGN